MACLFVVVCIYTSINSDITTLNWCVSPFGYPETLGTVAAGGPTHQVEHCAALGTPPHPVHLEGEQSRLLVANLKIEI